jgi:DNA-binding MarR family transcriptional regulator
MKVPVHRGATLDTRTIAVTEGANGQAGSLLETVFRISKSMRCLTGLALGEFGLFIGQDEMLLALDGSTPLSVSTLSKALDVRPSTVSKMADRLQERELVTRTKDADDKRLSYITITETGLELRKKVLDIHRRLEADFAKFYGPDGSVAIGEALERVDALIRGSRAPLL